MSSVAGVGSERGDWAELAAPGYLFATITLSLGVVLFAFNAFVVAVALPLAVAEFGGQAFIAWATSLYLIFAILTGAGAAALMRRFGARRMFLVAGAVFLAGTLLVSAAPDMGWLLAGRALQGTGTGFIEAACYVLIPRLFPSRLIAKVFGIEAVAWAVAAFGGPALSGLLAEVFSWRVALAASLPMALVFLALVPKVVSRDAGTGDRRTGLPVLALMAVTAGMALVLLSEGASGILPRLSGVAAGFACFAGVVWLDRLGSARLLPRGAFRLDSAVGLGLWVALLMPQAEAAQGVFVTYALQVLWQFTPLASGMASTVLALSWSGVQTWVAHRGFSRPMLIVLGAALLVGGQVLGAGAFATGSVPLLFLSQIIVGAAFGASWGALSQTVMEAAPVEDRDVTSGLLPVILSVGYGIGAAVLGLLANALGFAEAEGEALRRVIVVIFVAECVPAAFALVAARRLRRILAAG